MAISLDTSTLKVDLGWQTSPRTITWSHTCVANTTLLVVTAGFWQDVAGTGTITALTYNGVALTKAIGYTYDQFRTEIWYLINPTTGSAKTVSATVTGECDKRDFVSSSWLGTDTTSPLDVTNTPGNGSTNTTVSGTVTTTVANDVIIDAVARYGTAALTKGANQTLLKSDITGSSGSGSSYRIATTATSYGSTWTNSGAENWSYVIAAFKPASGSNVNYPATAIAATLTAIAPTITIAGSPTIYAAAINLAATLYNPVVGTPTWLAHIQGWVFTDEANARAQYMDGRSLYSIKPEFMNLLDSGANIGTLEIESPANGYGNINTYTPATAAEIKNYCLYPYFTIAGYHAGMANMCASSSKKTNAINTIVSFLQTTGFTGVELDFEEYSSWTATEYANYKSWINDLTTAVHAIGCKVIVVGPGIADATEQALYNNPYGDGTGYWFWEDFNSTSVDYLCPMLYDHMYDNAAGIGLALSPNQWVTDCCTWIKGKITDPTRIIAGMPAYGYWGSVGTIANPNYNAYNITKTDALNYISQQGATPARDSLSYEMTWTLSAFTKTFTSTRASGAKSGTLTTAWTLPTGLYAVTFSNGNVRVNTQFTNGSTAVTWDTGLTSSATVTFTVNDIAYWYQDTTGMNSKRALIEGQGITTISVWHLGDNDWFSGKLEPGIQGTQTAQALNLTVQTPVVSVTQGKNVTATAIALTMTTKAAASVTPNTSNVYATAINLTATLIQPVAELPIAPVYRKEFIYKAYTSAGVYISTWADVMSAPVFTSVINSTAGEVNITLARKFDSYGEAKDILLNNLVKIYAVDYDNTNGVLIYQGYISAYQPALTESGESVTVTLLPMLTKLEQGILTDINGLTTVTYNSYDPTDIIKDILDKSAVLTYPSDIPQTGATVSYTFNTSTYLQALQKCLELAPAGYYYYVDANNVLYFKQKLSTSAPDHTLFIGKHLAEVKPTKRMENVKNVVLFVGNGLFRQYTRSGSISLYGQRVYVYQDNRVTQIATADILSNNYLDNNENAEIRTNIRVVDNNYDPSIGYNIEAIKLGDFINIKNFGIYYPPTLFDVSLFDTDFFDTSPGGTQNLPMQVVSISYTPDYVDLELSSRPIPLNKRVEDIYRNLVNYLNSNNPSAPTQAV